MPLINIHKPQANCLIAKWLISETIEELKKLLLDKDRKDLLPSKFFQSTYRNAEWLAARYLLTELFPGNDNISIDYHASGKPLLQNLDGHISISHARPFVSLIYHPHKRVGIDIENITPRILRLATKFVNDAEKKWLGTKENLEQLYLVWAAKEAAFKMLGGEEIDFKENLSVNETKMEPEGITTINVTKSNKIENYTVYYRFLDNMIEVYTIADN